MKIEFTIDFFMKFINQFNGKRGILLILYLSFAVLSRVYIYWKGDSSPFFGIVVLFTLACVMYVCPFIFRKIKKINIKLEENEVSKKEKVLWIFFSFLGSFLTLLFWYLAYYPGSFFADCINQYGQAITGNYNDWHPALQTLFTYTLPLKLTGRADSIVLFQIFEYSCVLSYMSYTFFRYVNKKYAIFSLMYILLNPVTGNIMIQPWKDATFAMAATLLMIFGFRIYITEGEWLEQKGRMYLFIAILVFDTIFRHNAILFTVPLLFSILMTLKNTKRCLRVCCNFIIFLLIIKDPIYSTINVEKPENRALEILGVPMAILGNVAKESPESFDQDTEEFMFSVASQQEWKELYQCGDFNSIKWHTNWNVIEEEGVTEILAMTVKTFFKAPKESLKAFLVLTDIVYALGGYAPVPLSPGIEENIYGIEVHEILGKNVLETYTDILSNSIFKYIFYYIGVIDFCIVTSILGKCNERNKHGQKKIFYCIPILVYNFGTMLLLSGNDFRFFYLNFPVFPILLLILYGKRNDKCVVINKEVEDNV